MTARRGFRAAVPFGPGRGRPRWERRYSACLPVVDGLLLLGGVWVAQTVRSLAPGEVLGAVTGLQLVIGMTLAWVAFLAASGAYESRLLGQGLDEYKRVLAASWHFAAALAVGSYVIHTSLARGFFLLAIPLGTVLLVLGRNAIRRYVARLRARGHALHRMVVVGPAHATAEMIREIGRAHCGFQVVGTCTSGITDDGTAAEGQGRSGLEGIMSTIAGTQADTVAVVGSADMQTGYLRQLAWQLEGTGVDLMVSPAITDVAGPRVHVRPVASLSLLYVEEPRFTGTARLAKNSFDRVTAVLLLLLGLPFVLAIAVAVKMTSPGPVFFRQRRLGFGGREFTMWKFRTMHIGMDDLTGELAALNEADGPLFKMRRDLRITSGGRFLRTFSLDELPQLINVVAGHMSLVGPRPLPKALEAFAPAERRRLLVKPGMTGLGQVSGRSDLSWEESVRLDLYYVENWSLATDFLILFRTVAVVLRRRGAY